MARGCAELNDRLAASAYTSSLAGEMSIVRVALGEAPVHDPFDASVAFRIAADEPLADEYGRPYYSIEDPTRVCFAAERVA
jgi:hypothetical protein